MEYSFFSIYKHTHRDVAVELNVLKGMLIKVKNSSVNSNTRYFCKGYETIKELCHDRFDDKQHLALAYPAGPVAKKFL